MQILKQLVCMIKDTSNNNFLDCEIKNFTIQIKIFWIVTPKTLTQNKYNINEKKTINMKGIEVVLNFSLRRYLFISCRDSTVLMSHYKYIQHNERTIRFAMNYYS